MAGKKSGSETDRVSSPTDPPSGASESSQYAKVGRVTVPAGLTQAQVFVSSSSAVRMFGFDRGIFDAQRDLELQLGLDATSPQVFSAASTAGPVDRSNIVGTGISEKISSSIGHTAVPCVRVYVKRKVHESEITEVPIPKQIGGFETDVIEMGPVTPFAAIPSTPRFMGYERPARGGSGIGPAGVGTGTLGCVCVAQNKFCILSNNHVLANNDQLPVNSTHILQPGPSRFEMPHSVQLNFVGTLLVARRLNRGGADTRVDAALAWTDSPFTSGEHKSYQLNPTPMEPELWMPVRKDGWMTGSTVGQIDDVNHRISTTNGYMFAGQIRIVGSSSSLFSYPGDSGSLIVCDRPGSDRFRPVGLLFAGLAESNVTVANNIFSVQSELQITEFINRRNY
ncbi:MAG: hypothetical protein IT428_30255 [Planctomycetaceae bacterium]|nr:hypothetical protein [Planctomycetaceae bacterium]